MPVYKGADAALLNITNGETDNYHGSDGLGGVADDYPPDMSLLQDEHAAAAIGRFCRQHPGTPDSLAHCQLTTSQSQTIATITRL